MKNFIIAILATFLAVSAYAEKDVTKFLGIPVDGTKAEMRQKLMAKGYKPEKVGDSEYLAGEFNGRDVLISIVTNNNKVYRILVIDQYPTSARNIKTRFNTLVSQFENNAKYTALGDFSIPDGEDVSYEILIKKKKYEAYFFQKADIEKIQFDIEKIHEDAYRQMAKKYTEDQLANPTEEMENEFKTLSVAAGLETLMKKTVWFDISNFSYDDYRIIIRYDNEYNKANGEDL